MLNRLPIVLAVLALSGCATTQSGPAEPQPKVSLTTTENPGHIPFTEQDVQPFTPMPKSAGMERRLDRKLHELEKQMETVERRRRDLNRLLIESENRYKPLREDATDAQVAKYQAAQRASQKRIAALKTELDLETTAIENRLEETLAQLENHYAYQQARLKAEHRIKRTQETIKARSETALLTAEKDMLQADETKPVLEDGVAYYDLADDGYASAPPAREERQPKRDARTENRANDEPVTSRPASPPGNSDPDFPEQLAPPYAGDDSITVRDGNGMRIKYDAVLVYHEEETRDLWTGYLRAYGEDELFESHNPESGEYYIYLGTFSNPEAAQQRLASVEQTIGSAVNSKIVTRDLSSS